MTTIDFGRVTYEADFRDTLANARYELTATETLHAGRRRSAVLAIACAR